MVPWLKSAPELAPDGGPVDYENFRGSLDFADIKAELRDEVRHAERRGERKYYLLGRNYVLGRWRQRKLEEYDRYLREVAEHVKAERESGEWEKENLPF